MAKAAGEDEKSKAAGAKTKKDGLQDAGGRGLPWYSVRAQNYGEKKAGLANKAVLEMNRVLFGDSEGKNRVGEAKGGRVGGSAYNDQGANELIDGSLAQLDTVIASAELIKARLEGLFFNEGKQG